MNGRCLGYKAKVHLEFFKDIYYNIDMTKKTAHNKIAEEYKELNIPAEKIPLYDNPRQFAQSFEKCSIITYYNVSYSSTAAQAKPIHKK